MLTTTQVVFVAVLVVVCALVSFGVGVWYERGRSRQDIEALEADLAEVGEKLAAVQQPRHALPVAGRLELLSAPIAGQEREDDYRDDALAHRGPGWPVNGASPDEDETPSDWTKRRGLELERDIAAMIDRTDQWLRDITR